VSCVSYVASFSGLFFFITPSVFSNMYLSCVLCILCFQFLWIVLFHDPFDIQDTQDTGQMHVREYRKGNEKGQSRETGNIGYTRHRTNKWYSLTFICLVSCVPYVASFSGLSFFITPSVFSNMHLSCVLYTMSVGINITDASRDLIISVGHNITHRP
jgi:hypothetical protein